MDSLFFLADSRAELLVGGRRSSGGSSTTTTTTNYRFNLGQSNEAVNVVLGSPRSLSLIKSGQSNSAVQGINILA